MTAPTTLVNLRHRLGMAGGFTVGVRTAPLTPGKFGSFVTEGFAVSLNPECEKSFPASVASVTVLGIMADYVFTYRLTLAQPDKYFGAWLDRDSDMVYLDVVTVLDDKDKALQLARDNNQLAIFDLTSGEEIRTGVTR
jgi:hypothetical protein